MKGVKMRRNKQYSKEFKESTVQLVLNSDESIKNIAKDLDINYHTLYDWLKLHKRKEDKKKNPKSTKTKESLEEELKRLRRENLILKEERDILKKATAYFAKETL